MSHTPGPWSIHGNAILADGDQIAAVCPHEQRGRTLTMTDSGRSNARLIAAAPEMLEVLADIITNYDTGDWPGWGGDSQMRTIDEQVRLMNKARALLARIEG